MSERVRWQRWSPTWMSTIVAARSHVEVVREPGRAEWRVGVRNLYGHRWVTWCRSEAAAKRAGVALARRLAGGG